jgi:hypothetical protein
LSRSEHIFDYVDRYEWHCGPLLIRKRTIPPQAEEVGTD